MKLRLLISAIVISLPSSGYATDYSVRFMTGGYVSTQRFAQPIYGSNSNDYATISTRLYLHASQWGSGNYDFVADLRDKNDFFDILDQQRLTLTPGNTFQPRQLSLGTPRDAQGLYWGAGRFALPDAGAVYTDGAEIGYRWNRDFRSSVFGGLNPYREDLSYLTFNPNSTVWGTYSLFQPKMAGWNRYLYWSNALVGETIQGTFTRFYFYNNLIYQWNAPNQLLVLAYLDFIPRIYLQTGLVSYRQQLGPQLTSTAQLSAIDVIQYSLQQGLLELLPPSPYNEASLNLSQKLNPTFYMNYNAAYGVRNYDGLDRIELMAGPSFPRFIDRHLSFSGSLGYRRDFTTIDTFFRVNAGYYSRLWELTLSEEYGPRTQSDGNIFHTMITDASVARYLSRELYVMGSVEDATMEGVDILSGFFKLGYRFGSKDVAPLRDGAPPRGPL